MEKNSQSSSQTSLRLPHPSGFLRLAFRFPIALYRLHLGWLLGKRFLLLEHLGRKSGVIRRTVIEVVDHDLQDGSFIVAAAWGNKADWFKNISVHPEVTVTVGHNRFSATVRTVTIEEATRHLTMYARKHPFAFKQLGSMLLGLTSNEPDRYVKFFAESVPLVKFVPLE